MGVWGNAAEMIVLLGMGTYTAYCTEEKALIAERIHSTAVDRLERIAFIRRAIEEWKVAEGNIGDLIVCPPPITHASQRWATFVKAPTTLCLTTLAHEALGRSTVHWSWDGNLHRDTAVTFTGIKTPPNMWRNKMNIKPAPVEGIEERYQRAATPNVWYTGLMVQVGDGHQDPVMQKLAARMNWRQCANRISSMTWPGKDANMRIGYCLESNYQLDLFKRTGWSGGLPDIEGPDRRYTWGWGVQSRFGIGPRCCTGLPHSHMSC